MKIFILRHEKRGNDPTFYSPLLEEGLKNSENLKYILENLNIDLIFASPFKRVLQTLKPYCEYKNIKINIEYSLYEAIHDEAFDKDNFRFDLKDTDEEYFLKNLEYESYLELNNIEYGANVKERVKNFEKYITEKYKNTNKNILLASHMSIVNTFLEEEHLNFYPMGGITLINKNNKNIRIPINYK